MIDKKRFENALKTIESGEYQSEKLIEKFQLTGDQQKQLDELIEKMKQLELKKK
jgi:hypothetical protein